MAPRKRLKREVKNDFESESSQTLSPKCCPNWQTSTHLTDNWIQYLNEDLTQELSHKFDKLVELIDNNKDLETKVKEWQKKTINEKTKEIAIESKDIDECLQTLESMNTKSKNELKAIKERFKEKKREKSGAEREVKTWSKQLDESETQLNELTDNKDQNESKELAKVMKCRYKMSANQTNVFLDFEDRTRGQRLISSQSKDISNDFWTFLNKKYDL